MKLIGLLMIRNEQWVIGASLDAAMRWCDGVAIYLDRCEDETFAIVDTIVRAQPEKSCHINYDRTPVEHWDEMDKRQCLLDDGRRLGGTHFAMIDADEILTANNVPQVRGWTETLRPGEVLDLPMIAVWNGLESYRRDDSIWSHAYLSVAFSDAPGLGWMPRGEDRYQFHHRVPFGAIGQKRRECEGGVMHLQFADWRRLVAKHVLYRMVEHIRWPGRLTLAQLNATYDLAIDRREPRCEPIPPAWWDGWRKDEIRLAEKPWHEDEIKRLLLQHGPAAFQGLDLKGFA